MLRRPLRTVEAILAAFLLVAMVANKAAATDEVLLVSTRGIGTRCSHEALISGLHCEQLLRTADNKLVWRPLDWHAIASDSSPTIFYVHGNRIPTGVAKPHGLQVYEALSRSDHNTESRSDLQAPLRFIIWSWPSEQIRGQFRDYQVKAARTRPVGWQLAWAIDQLPEETPVGIVGYSYGARVTTGTLHLLAGGSLSGLRLANRHSPNRAPIPTVLIAAATNRNWLSPHGYHRMAGQMIDNLTLVNNRHDPAMRFYAFGTRQRGAHALGYQGIAARSLTHIQGSLREFDATDGVGRDHSLHKYLAATPQIAALRERVTKEVNTEASTLATHETGPRS